MPTDVDITIEPMAGLTREHRLLDGVIEDARLAAEAAVHETGDVDLAAAALVAIHDLEAFLDERLALHIAKEEDVLFPALRLDRPMSTTVDELIEQHDEVRSRHADLLAALDAVDQGHHEVDAERARLSQGIRAATGPVPTAEQLTELWETVRRLQWILQGHFGDEEDDLFAPAEDLLTAGQLAELQRQTVELETSWPARRLSSAD